MPVPENRWKARPATETCSDIIFEETKLYGSMLHLDAADVVQRLNQRDRFLNAAAAEQEKVERLKAERLKLDSRIRNQRLALRQNWQIIEMRAQYRRAWYPSPLLRSILNNRRKNPPWWRRLMTRAIFGTSANEQLRRVFHS